MPSNLLNHLRMMFRTTTSNRELALANNFIYVNEEKISRSLICPICLDPLLDPQTHVLCENSFCNRCIRKLKLCPCCRAPILNNQDLKLTSHVIRNILDELEIQCNVCKQKLLRGHFSSHIKNHCLEQLPTECNLEDKYLANSSMSTQDDIDRHLSNLYRRIHQLENELFELKKTIFISLLILSTIFTLVFFGSIFFYIIFSFLSLVCTQWIPTFLDTITRFLFDFSPLIIFIRIFCLGLYFSFICYKRHPSDFNLLTLIICLVIVCINLLILIINLILHHSTFVFILIGLSVLIKYYANHYLLTIQQISQMFHQRSI